MRPLRLLLVLAACSPDPTDPDTATTGDATGGTEVAEGTSGGTMGAPTTTTATDTGSPTVPGTTTGTTEIGETSGTTADTGGSDSGTGELPDGLELEETFNVGIENDWVRVERWRDTNPAFIQEDRFSLDQRASQTGQRLKFFASDPAPHSSLFLLYYAPGWDAPSKSTPILLAHGANDQADRAWANPGESGDFGCGQSECPTTGLMQDLSAAGYSVFAISHPHSQGDNYFWAAQIGDAIRVIRERTGAAQVDVIGWSKGVMSARMYTSSLTQDWGTPYQNDVRKLLLLGGPNLGFDYIFRYGTAHDTGIYADFMGKIHAPGPHDELLIFGQWVDRAEYAIFKSAKGDPYRGQLQMLARWDDIYPLTGTANNGAGAYAVFDSDSTYYGEAEVKGTISRGKGIDVGVDQGSVIEAMVDAGIPETISTYLLCGDLNLADNTKLIPGIPNEIAGPSDGIVFIDSCSAPDGVGNLAEVALLEDVNHLQLGWHAEAVATIVSWLGD